jgi:hypothetical protein
MSFTGMFVVLNLLGSLSWKKRWGVADRLGFMEATSNEGDGVAVVSCDCARNRRALKKTKTAMPATTDLVSRIGSRFLPILAVVLKRVIILASLDDVIYLDRPGCGTISISTRLAMAH